MIHSFLVSLLKSIRGGIFGSDSPDSNLPKTVLLVWWIYSIAHLCILHVECSVVFSISAPTWYQCAWNPSMKILVTKVGYTAVWYNKGVLCTFTCRGILSMTKIPPLIDLRRETKNYWIIFMHVYCLGYVLNSYKALLTIEL